MGFAGKLYLETEELSDMKKLGQGLCMMKHEAYILQKLASRVFFTTTFKVADSRAKIYSPARYLNMYQQ